jgi:hypothetical protein
MSVAVLVTWRGFRLFLGGDIERFTERKIADLDAVSDVDVYEADHHGSDSSTSSAFIRELAPNVVIVSNGDDAQYQHPRQATLDTLARLQPAPVVFQTNRYTKGGKGGNVDTAFIADLEPSGPEGTILLSVDADSGQYRVSFRNTSRTFAMKHRIAPTARVVLERLLPDPVGRDADREEVTVRNRGPGPVELTGWYLQDESGRRWPLAGLGTLAAGASATTVRNGFPLNLNNDGDTILLMNALGEAEDRFTYGPVTEGAVVVTGH